MTSLIVSSFGPPVAIIGKSRSILRNALIISTVFLPPDTLMIRARYYRNVINPSTGYAQGRYADGSFLTDAGNAFSFTRFIPRFIRL